MIKINKISICQYFLIYLLLQYQGGRILTVLGTDVFYATVLIIVSYVLLQKGLIFYRNTSGVRIYIAYVMLFFIYMLVSILYTSGGMTIGTTLSIMSRFLLLYAMIGVDPENFLTRFIKMVVSFALISLIIYFSHFIGATALWTMLSKFFYAIRSESIYVGDTYGLFVIVFKTTDLARNSYMFGEPGEYQIIINAALFFLLFFNGNIHISKKRKLQSLIIILVTLLSIQSTTGFISMIAIILFAMFQQRGKIDKKIKLMMWIFVIIAVVYSIGFASKDSILYTAFFNKFISSAGTLDFSGNTGEARVWPYLRLLEIIKEKPLQVLFGVGPNGLTSSLLGTYTVNGLVNLIMICGLIFTIILYVFFIRCSYKVTSSVMVTILALFISINQAIGQPEILNSITMLIFMYGYIKMDTSIEEVRNRSIYEA